MSVKQTLGGHQPNPKATKVSGYVDTPIPKKCGTCEYLVKQTLCRQHRVQRDTQMLTDKLTGFKIVDAQNGCCNYWSGETKHG